MADSDEKISKKIIITNKLGIHARPAGMIAGFALKAKSNVWLIKNGEKVDASSIIDILTLACSKGSIIRLKINDIEDHDILNYIVELVKSGFGEQC